MGGSIIVISEKAALQVAASKLWSQMFVVTRMMLLNSDWMEQRDKLLRDCECVLLEAPHCRTASGTRNDRKVADRMLSYVSNPSSVFLMFAPRRSNA